MILKMNKFPSRLLILLFASALQSVHSGVINSDAARKCRTNPTGRVNAMLDLPSVDPSLPSGSRMDIATSLRNTLKARTAKSQEPVIAGLRAINPDLDIQPFWIVNRLAVKDVPCALLPSIASIPHTFSLRTERVVDVTMLFDSVIVHDRAGDKNKKPNGEPEWGVDKINAPKVWPKTRGEGVVVAAIDTGMRRSHESLKGNWREEYGWLDGVTNSSAGEPRDGMGHGTHVVGTICGGLGIGVAPGAKWIGCKGCTDDGKCVENGLLTCGQWMACPYRTDESNSTNVNCEKRPDVVANSWGSLIGTDDFYNEVILNWRRVGIIPVFAIGNTGPICSTTGSPGNQANVISVGATDNKDKIARFSSRGPTSNSTVKPEVSAPGKDIFSAWCTGDDKYSTISGTSMACPHVAGAVALLLAKNKAIVFDQIEKALEETAFKPPGLSYWDTCTLSQWPNNAYGHGRIDVDGAYKHLPDVPGTTTELITPAPTSETTAEPASETTQAP